MHKFAQFAEPIPAEAEIYGSLKIYTFQYEGAQRPYFAKLWRGKAVHPYAHHSFLTDKSRAKYIAEQKQTVDANARFKDELKVRKTAGKAAGAELFQVGTLLAYSWGYDPTNVDFFKVVERKGLTVKIRPIGGRQKNDSEGFMSNRVMAVRDAFIGKAVSTKRINGTSLSMKNDCAIITHESETHYCS